MVSCFSLPFSLDLSLSLPPYFFEMKLQWWSDQWYNFAKQLVPSRSHQGDCFSILFAARRDRLHHQQVAVLANLRHAECVQQCVCGGGRSWPAHFFISCPMKLMMMVFNWTRVDYTIQCVIVYHSCQQLRVCTIVSLHQLCRICPCLPPVARGPGLVTSLISLGDCWKLSHLDSRTGIC